MKETWLIAALVIVLVCAAAFSAAFFTNPATDNEEAALTSAPSNNVAVDRQSASVVIDQERPRVSEFNLAAEFETLRTEIESINERLLNIEGDRADDYIKDSLASEEAARVETRMTEDDETEVARQLSEWDDQFDGAIEDAWSNDLQAGIENAIADDNELLQAITSVGCRSTICRIDMEQDAKTAYTFMRLIQKQPNLTQIIKNSVSLKKRDGTVVFFLNFAE